jgi:hypothetical protein
MDRRIFLAGSAALGAAGTLPWSIAGAGDSPVRHILPTVSHDAMLVKVSFIEPQLPPKLTLDGKPVDGAATDGEGLCWAFLATGLTPSRDYTFTCRRARPSLRRRVVEAVPRSRPKSFFLDARRDEWIDKVQSSQANSGCMLSGARRVHPEFIQ